MLSSEVASVRLKDFFKEDGARRRRDRAKSLPEKLRPIGFGLAGHQEDGKSVRHAWSRIEKAAERFADLSFSDQEKVLQAIVPELASPLMAGWKLLERMPYQMDWSRKPFRAPNYPEASQNRRIRWLCTLIDDTTGYEEDIRWLAAWGPYLGDYAPPAVPLGVLFAAAIDQGGPEGEAVFEILCDSAGGQHEIGKMGRHVTTALLSCSKPEAWEFVEKMLLAAQRQEGLRQAILESIDEAHPEAFRRMLRLILDENLIRFSATVRAVDVWLGLQWDAVSTGVVKKTLEQLLTFFDDEAARRAAIEGDDAEAAYYAMWTLAFDDVEAAMPVAKKMFEHPNVEHRFVGYHLLRQIGLLDSVLPILSLLEDEDLRMVMLAVCQMGSYENYYDVKELKRNQTRRPEDLFERLEAVVDRFPKKMESLEALVWPWWKLTAGREEVVDALWANRGKRPPSRMIPYLQYLDTWGRSAVIGAMAQEKKWDAETRRTLFAMVGDPATMVREAALKGIEKCRVEEHEVLDLEKLLKRKSADLRRGVIKLLAKRKDQEALASAERLLRGPAPQRTAGLEILRLMTEEDRSVEQCRKIGRAHRESQKRVTSDEETLLDAVLAKKEEIPTLDDALGLCDHSNRTKPERPRKHKIKFVTPAAEACLQSLDDLIHAYRETPVELKNGYFGGEAQLLGNIQWGFPHPNRAESLEQGKKQLPLVEVWEKWCRERPKKLRDPDGFELIRALAILLREGMSGSKAAIRKQELFGKFDTEKLRYKRLVIILLQWLMWMDSPPKGYDFLLQAAETALAMVPEKELGSIWKQRYMAEGNLRWRWNDSPYMRWFAMLEHFETVCRIERTSRQTIAYWKLCRWIDEPEVKELTYMGKKKEGLTLPRQRPDFSVVAKAYRAGAATDDDAIDHLLGPRGVTSDWWRGRAFDSLRELTTPRKPKKYAEDRWPWPLVDRVRDRILEIELVRGELPTAATRAANGLRSVWGTDNVLHILTALGKGTLVRGYSYDGVENRNTVFSHLLRICLPTKKDTPTDFKKKAISAKISEQRLLDLAVYAPQWSRFVEHAIGCEGLEDGIWWIHAHTKDAGWSIDNEIRESWEASVAERTPLSSQDLLDGAVDVEWFHRVYAKLKKKRWETLLKSAKYAAGGGGHKRAELFASALLGREKKTELVKRINEKRNQDAVRALGLLPLTRGKSREKDLLSRYQLMQEFVRQSRQFGSQRQASEKRAATIGQENLARTAGYADPIRLQWAMESHAVADLADGPLTLNVDDVTATLSIEESGGIDFTIERAGKVLKSVPAILKKNKAFKELRERRNTLKRQVSRTRPTLEQMMCRGTLFTGEELRELLGHAILGPMLSRLVLVGQGNMGYPVRGGKALEDCRGEVTAVKKTDHLRIAHPMDLFESGRWHQWQRDCFARERLQPFKQIFRELYPITSDEKKQKTISLRYAGHQVNPSQALALLGSRGWVNVPEEGVRRTFHDEGYSAGLEFLEGFFTPAEIEGLTLEGVQFTRKDQWKPVPLKEIPSRLFSEVMRDLDLVVSVAHRGGVDPEASASTVEMRTDLMRETLAVLGIENVEFKKDHAVIQGDLGKYSVHLGSGVVHKMPGGAMLIVPVHSQHRGRIFLPFADDDPKTAEVLSKVLLLARDREIQDPNILEQIQILGKIKSERKRKKRPTDRALSEETTTRYFENAEGAAGRFWEITLDGKEVTVRYGRVGGKGQQRTKTFESAEAAQKHLEKQIAKKTENGYREAAPSE